MCTERRSRSMRWTPRRARSTVAGFARIARPCAPGWLALPVGRSTWPWKRAPAGCSWARRSPPRARSRTWPSRRRRARCAVRSAGPRPIARTRAGCARCCLRGVCRRRRFPPAHVREWRTRTRLRKTLVDERTSWLQRIQATLFHHGIANGPDQLLRANGRAFLRTLELPPAAGERIEIALAIIDEIDRQLIGLEREIGRLARRQPGCQALMRQYGIGPLTAPTILSELGDVSRLSASRKAVRCSGLTSGGTARLAARAPAGPPGKAPRSCAGRSMRPPNRPASPPAPTTP